MLMGLAAARAAQLFSYPLACGVKVFPILLVDLSNVSGGVIALLGVFFTFLGIICTLAVNIYLDKQKAKREAEAKKREDERLHITESAKAEVEGNALVFEEARRVRAEERQHFENVIRYYIDKDKRQTKRSHALATEVMRLQNLAGKLAMKCPEPGFEVVVYNEVLLKYLAELDEQPNTLPVPERDALPLGPARDENA
jgi:hypothetical protein